MCLAILLSESPLFTVYVVPSDAAGASLDAAELTSEKSAFGEVDGVLEEPVEVVSEKLGDFSVLLESLLKGSLYELPSFSSKIPIPAPCL